MPRRLKLPNISHRPKEEEEKEEEAANTFRFKLKLNFCRKNIVTESLKLEFESWGLNHFSKYAFDSELKIG